MTASLNGPRGIITVLSAQFLKEAWIDKDMPYVLLDVQASRNCEKRLYQGRRDDAGGGYCEEYRQIPA